MSLSIDCGHPVDYSVWSSQNPYGAGSIPHLILETRKLTRTLRFSSAPTVTWLACQRISLEVLNGDNRWDVCTCCIEIQDHALWNVSLSQHPDHFKSLKKCATYLLKMKWVAQWEKPITGDIQVGTMDMEFTDTWSFRQNSLVDKGMGSWVN